MRWTLRSAGLDPDTLGQAEGGVTAAVSSAGAIKLPSSRREGVFARLWRRVLGFFTVTGGALRGVTSPAGLEGVVAAPLPPVAEVLPPPEQELSSREGTERSLLQCQAACHRVQQQRGGGGGQGAPAVAPMGDAPPQPPRGAHAV